MNNSIQVIEILVWHWRNISYLYLKKKEWNYVISIRGKALETRPSVTAFAGSCPNVSRFRFMSCSFTIWLSVLIYVDKIKRVLGNLILTVKIYLKHGYNEDWEFMFLFVTKRF